MFLISSSTHHVSFQRSERAHPTKNLNNPFYSDLLMVSFFHFFAVSMSLARADLLLGLPAELACGVVGRLALRDVFRLDSAYKNKRYILRKNIFQSPLCVLSNVDSFEPNADTDHFRLIEYFMVHVENLKVCDGSLCAEYLSKCGQSLKNAWIGWCSEYPTAIKLIAQHCHHRHSLTVCTDYRKFAIPLQAVFSTCTELESIQLQLMCDGYKSQKLGVPGTRQAKLKSLDLDCDRGSTQYVLSMCAPDSMLILLFRNGTVSSIYVLLVCVRDRLAKGLQRAFYLTVPSSSTWICRAPT